MAVELNCDNRIGCLRQSRRIWWLYWTSFLIDMLIGCSTTRNTEVNLVVKKWHHITVVWNGDKCHLKLYAGGKLAVTQDMTVQCSVTLTSTTLMKFGSADPEGNLTGLWLLLVSGVMVC